MSSSEGQGSKLYSAAAINNTQQYICNMLSVLPSTSSNVTTISQVLPSSITKYHQILPCSICTQYCMSVWHAVLVLSHGDYYKVLPNITKYCQVLPSITGFVWRPVLLPSHGDHPPVNLHYPPAPPHLVSLPKKPHQKKCKNLTI